MKNIIIDESNELIEGLLKDIEQTLVILSGTIVTTKRRPLNNEKYFSDKELAEMLNISRRGLQCWRNNRVIPYIKIAGGKILYRESDIQKILEKNLVEAFE